MPIIVIGLPNTGVLPLSTLEEYAAAVAFLISQYNTAAACIFADAYDFEVVDDFTVDCLTGEWSVTISSVTYIPNNTTVPIQITINGNPVVFSVAAVTLTPNTGTTSVGGDGVSIVTTSVLAPLVSLHISGNLALPLNNGDTATITITDGNAANNSQTHTISC